MNEHEAHKVHLPSPSVWPAVLAAGLTLMAFGIIANLTYSLAGAILTVAGIAGWVIEMRHG
jgi:cytochrome c oxidase subunit 1